MTRCMRNRGLGSWIARRARIAPDRLALVFGERTWTYGGLAADIEWLARGLSGLGVRPGDRVGYLGPNHPVFLQTAFAAGLLGAVFVPLNHRLAATDLAYVVEDAGISVLLYGDVPTGLVDTLWARTRVRDWVAVGSAPAEPLRHGIARGPRPAPQRFALGDLVIAAQSRLVDPAVDLDDLAFLVYTSGTTGRPKGVMLTHGNLTWNALDYLSVADFRPDDVTLAIAPLFRAGGWGVTLLPTLQRGGTVVLLPAFEPSQALGMIARHSVTTLFGGPELLNALVRTPGWADADLTTLRFVISGGNVVHESLMRTYLDRGVPFLQGYGLTEAAPMALMLDAADALRKLGSAGVPPLFVDVRVGRADLTDAGVGEVGEILVKGPNVMRGYWRRPEDTEATIVQGWLRTGDAGRMDDEGHVYVLGRLKDVFLSAGEPVYPAEVEGVLTDHPAVAEAALVPVADEGAGRVGLAYVVLVDQARATGAELRRHCEGRLARHQVPSSVVFVAALPRNPAGKLLRQQLLEEAAALRRSGAAA